MNLFRVASSPYHCARALDDIRLNKMILETAQMLSTAARKHAPPEWISEHELYRPTHANLPVPLWIAEGRENYTWTLAYLQSLFAERRFRLSRGHATERLYLSLAKASEFLPESSYTQQPYCGIKDYSSEGLFRGYRLTLIDKWLEDEIQSKRNPHKHPPSWIKRGEPDWFSRAMFQRYLL